MASFTRLTSVFERLKGILQPYARNLAVKRDTPMCFYVDTRFVQKNGEPLFFGAIVINESDVSYHLMPIYLIPELADGVSTALRRRMKGKSCFRFADIDEGQFKELEALTRSAYLRFKERGFV